MFKSLPYIVVRLGIVVSIYALASCGGGGDTSPINTPPTAINASITEGGNTTVGTILSGSYVYSDAEKDKEGLSTFRWLRDRAAIDGAIGSSYTTILVDSGKSITFEVLPVALTGETTGDAVVSNGIFVTNSAPTVSNVNITDNNGGYAVVGDQLTGAYEYSDLDEDGEGTTTFSWLRNGIAIYSATSLNYTLTEYDVAKLITFVVLPHAETGEKTGDIVTSPTLATGTPPVVSGFARYLDTNFNAISDAGDQLIVPFDQRVSVNTVNQDDFILPVNGDNLGVAPSISAAPNSNEITITFGDSANLTIRQDYSGSTTVNSPSGIDVNNLMSVDAIEGASGIDAESSTPIDIIPGFVGTEQSLGPVRSNSVILGDVDGDNDLDIVVVNSNIADRENMGTKIHINDGSGNFTDTGQSLNLHSHEDGALGDVDGDNDLDLVIVCLFNEGNRIYINDGYGTFNDSGQSLGVNWSHGVNLADINNDGRLEIIVANSNSNEVYTNNGAGAFTDSGQSIGTTYNFSTALGDIDDDGDLDMVAGKIQANQVYTNDGNGNFTDTGQSLRSEDESVSVALGDVDGDGDLDMVDANMQDQPNRVYLNDGSGNFTDSGQNLGLNSSNSVALGDLDDDGDLDIFIANSGESLLYINDGAGNFTDSGIAFGTDASLSGKIVVGDLDADGDLDVVISNFGNNESTRVYLNSLTSN